MATRLARNARRRRANIPIPPRISSTTSRSGQTNGFDSGSPLKSRARRAFLQQSQQAPEQIDGLWWAPSDVQINGNDGAHAPRYRVAWGEKPAIEGAVSNRYDPFGRRRRVVGALQRLAHVLGDGACDHQHIGMPRGGDKAQAKSFEIVERVLQGVDFELAAIAGTRINLANRKAAAQPPACHCIEPGGKLCQF